MKGKFKEGDDVVYHRRKTKHQCPYCGYVQNSSPHLADILVAKIRGLAFRFGNLHCSCCEGVYPVPKNWLQLDVRGNIGYYIAAPPNLLRKVT